MPLFFVIPAKAGIQTVANRRVSNSWTPAFAGVTASVVLTLAATFAPAYAQDVYPTRSIRMVIPYPPGGGSDITGRTIAQKLGEALGQQIIVDNRGGGGGNIGTDIVAKAVPDGYTICMALSGPFSINGSLMGKLPFDPLKDFALITLAGATPNLLVAHPSVTAHTVKELIALAKASPGKINFASSGLGTPAQLAGELFNTMAGVKLVHVPYKGAAPALTDLLAGQVQLMFSTMPPGLPQVKAGKLKAIAVTSAKRSLTTPELPTIAESGLPGFEAIT
jgi:tripartite-type tricarboxylate transporter receptor subunit TctC